MGKIDQEMDAKIYTSIMRNSTLLEIKSSKERDVQDMSDIMNIVQPLLEANRWIQEHIQGIRDGSINEATVTNEILREKLLLRKSQKPPPIKPSFSSSSQSSQLEEVSHQTFGGGVSQQLKVPEQSHQGSSSLSILKGTPLKMGDLQSTPPEFLLQSQKEQQENLRYYEEELKESKQHIVTIENEGGGIF